MVGKAATQARHGHRRSRPKTHRAKRFDDLESKKRPKWPGHGSGLDRSGASFCHRATVMRARNLFLTAIWRRHAGVGQGGAQLHSLARQSLQSAQRFLRTTDIHIHIPKARFPGRTVGGVAMVTSMVSALSIARAPGPGDDGEITLRARCCASAA